jgi:SAM-dependent methyltransferase
MYCLNLGCGNNQFEIFTFTIDGIKMNYSCLNLDIDPKCYPDIVCNIEEGLSFEDNSIEVVYAKDFLEHIYPDKTIFVIEEIWRVLKDRALFFHITPSTDGRGAFQDPTHRSFWNANTWIYFTNDGWRDYLKTKAKFDIISLENVNYDEKLKLHYVVGSMRAIKN